MDKWYAMISDKTTKASANYYFAYQLICVVKVALASAHLSTGRKKFILLFATVQFQ